MLYLTSIGRNTFKLLSSAGGGGCEADGGGIVETIRSRKNQPFRQAQRQILLEILL